MPIDPSDLGDAIRSRRSIKPPYPDTPVSPEVIAELCELATWAPNHKRTEPWRFAVFTGDGRQRLGDTLADALEAEGGNEGKVAKTRGKYTRSPVVIVVGSIPGTDPMTTCENRDAVAAGINNLLLGASVRGLATLWSSVSPASAAPVLELCGFPEGTVVVGAVYLGHPNDMDPPARRNEPVIVWHSS